MIFESIVVDGKTDGEAAYIRSLFECSIYPITVKVLYSLPEQQKNKTYYVA